MKPTRTGFILDSKIPTLESIRRGDSALRHWFLGQYTGSSVALMRFRWIAEWVNSHSPDHHYELYRPWRRYDTVVFLKSMGVECARLARHLKERGTRVVFDCNVDYLTPATGNFYYEGMKPSEAQQHSCKEMLELSDAVIADSSHIQTTLSECHGRVRWIPDNVRDDLIRESGRSYQADRKPLVLQWSGEAVKLFDLLLLKDVLPAYAKRIRLRLVTSDLSAFTRWPVGQREQFQDMLAAVPHEIVKFSTVEALLSRYDASDVVLSPRFLDNSYNLGHTEWKITLGMARGCVALCSPQQSYLDVSERSTGGQGIRICRTADDWRATLESLLSGSTDWAHERASAASVVKEHYATSIVAQKHLDWISSR